MSDKKVIVIGAGLAGLSGAIYLRKRGFQVEVFEQNEQLGGKAGEIRANGFRFDTGPSLVTMPFVLEDLFREVGADRSALLPWLEIDPICRYFWPDGSQLDAVGDVERMQNLIEAFAPGEGAAFRRFLAYCKRIYDATADIFLTAPIHETTVWLRLQTLKKIFSLPRIDPFHTVDQSVRRFFRDPRLVQLFDRYATYNGSNPFQAPATLNIIAYVEFVLGAVYPHGGIYRLVSRLQQIAQELGVIIHAGQRVEKILYDDRHRVTGVQVGGDGHAADAVLCNADVVQTYANLIEGFPRERRKLERLEPSLSGMVFLWSVKKNHPMLAHHNIFFSADYRREFNQLFVEKTLPSDPTVYIAITSKTDPADAPPGEENWFVLINAPYLDNTRPADSGAAAALRKAVFARLAQAGIDIAPYISHEQVIGPDDFYRLYGSNRGSIYGISSNSRQTAFRRPANRNKRLSGLYFAGGSAHPGGGIPLVVLSAKMAADLIARHTGGQQQQAAG